VKRHALLGVLAVGCGDRSVGYDALADVAGEYSVAIANGRNGCNLGGWDGPAATNVPLVVSQAAADVSATVGGGAAILLGLGYGTAEYRGRVVGRTLTLTIHGTASKTVGACAYTMKSVVRAIALRDFIEGTVSHETATNGASDCAAVACASEQRFNGNRPPR